MPVNGAFKTGGVCISVPFRDFVPRGFLISILCCLKVKGRCGLLVLVKRKGVVFAIILTSVEETLVQHLGYPLRGSSKGKRF